MYKFALAVVFGGLSASVAAANNTTWAYQDLVYNTVAMIQKNTSITNNIFGNGTFSLGNVTSLSVTANSTDATMNLTDIIPEEVCMHIKNQTALDFTTACAYFDYDRTGNFTFVGLTPSDIDNQTTITWPPVLGFADAFNAIRAANASYYIQDAVLDSNDYWAFTISNETVYDDNEVLYNSVVFMANKTVANQTHFTLLEDDEE